MSKSIARREIIANTMNAVELSMTYTNPLAPFAFAECEEEGNITAYVFNLEPNDPNALECKDKMIND